MLTGPGSRGGRSVRCGRRGCAHCAGGGDGWCLRCRGVDGLRQVFRGCLATHLGLSATPPLGATRMRHVAHTTAAAPVRNLPARGTPAESLSARSCCDGPPAGFARWGRCLSAAATARCAVHAERDGAPAQDGGRHHPWCLAGSGQIGQLGLTMTKIQR